MCLICLVIYQICIKVEVWHTLEFITALFVVLFLFLPPRGIFRPNQWPPERIDDAVHSLEIPFMRESDMKDVLDSCTLWGHSCHFCGEAPVT